MRSGQTIPMPRGIIEIDWIPVDVRVEVPVLGIHGVAGNVVGLEEAAHGGGVIPEVHVVLAGFGVAFLPGEAVGVVAGVGRRDFSAQSRPGLSRRAERNPGSSPRVGYLLNYAPLLHRAIIPNIPAPCKNARKVSRNAGDRHAVDP